MRILKKILRYLVGFSFNLLARCLAGEHRTAVFRSDPQLSDNPLAFFLYLHRTLGSEWSFVWLVQDLEGARGQLEAEGIRVDGRVRLLKAGSVAAHFWSCAARLCVDSHGSFTLPRCGIGKGFHMSLWHGSPLKRIGQDTHEGSAFQTDSDLVVASAGLFVPILSSGLGVSSDRIVCTGQPRNDWMLGGTPAGNRAAGFSPYIMWMPTYTISRGSPEVGKGYKGKDFDVSTDSFGVLNLSDFPVLDSHLGSRGMKLLLKLHPYDVRNDLEWPSYENIVVIKWNDERILGSGLYSALGNSEALISDVSSVIFDYMLTGKRIGIDRSIAEKSLRGLAFSLDFSEFNSFDISSKSDFFTFIDTVAHSSSEGRGAAPSFSLYNGEVPVPFCRNIFDQLSARGVFE
ncbi:CDP-glycerol glycerophosphotransferase family protein [Geomonas sp. RF6]|uniref:CDP-glycerol glycerophosphotransferase family protein n=1 Tax=Geomonas sp. RF6 TaxID=2897342 RepID=UPI001E296ECE|nr:CDP-glycerol glycerophosphotransferase family protein [Geomonas sp. RF6]UFS69769.1 CDP-glycerol glycerophosphotransferase family protein [Geomonas sp. RF6]